MKSRITSRIFVLAIIICMILSTAVAGAETISFSDISDSWAKDYIIKAAEAGIIKGNGDGTFQPKANITHLQAIVMLSRLYNIDSSIKQQITSKYSDFVKNNVSSSFSWAYEELPTALALNIVSEDALKALNDNNILSRAATKEEVSIYLTNAMMLRDEVEKVSGTVYSLPFKDTNKVSTKARPYIYVMYNKKILGGDTEGNVNPGSNITRDVFAKMASVAYDYINDNNVKPELPSFETYTTVKGTITNVTLNSVESYLDIEVESTKEKRVIRMTAEQTSVKINGKASEIKKLEKGMFIECTISDTNAIAKTITVDTNIIFVEGKIKSVYYVSPQKLVITDSNDKEITYSINDKATITLDGKITEMKNLVKLDEVKVKLVDDVVVQVDSVSRIKTLSGKIKNIVFDFPIVLSVEDSTGKISTYIYKQEPAVTRNTSVVTFDQLRVGDSVTVKTEYDVLTAIDATAAVTVADKVGIIKEITISAQNALRIQDEEGNIIDYKLSSGAKFSVFDKGASIYDLRIGYRVELSFDGDEIVSVDAKNDDTSQELVGKIVYVNSVKRTVMLKVTNDFGQNEIITLSLNNSTRIITLAGEIKYIKDLKSGDTVISVGTYNGGSFDAISIIIK